MAAFRSDSVEASLLEIQTLSGLLDALGGASTCEEVQIPHPRKFLYGSQRGHDSFVTYAIYQADGLPTCMGHQSRQDKTPRHLSISPGREFLLAANQDTDKVVTFRLDPASGDLVAAGHSPPGRHPYA